MARRGAQAGASAEELVERTEERVRAAREAARRQPDGGSEREIEAQRLQLAETFAGRAREALLLAPREHSLRLTAAVVATILILEWPVCVALAVWRGAGGGLWTVNLTVISLVFGAMCLLVAADPRRFGALLSFVIPGLVLRALLLAAVWPLVGTDELAGDAGLALLVSLLVIDAGSAGALTWRWIDAGRARYGLRALTRGESEVVMAVAEVLFTAPAISPTEVAANVDSYLADVSSPRYRRRIRRALTRAWIAPVGKLKPPLPFVDTDRRRRLLEAVERPSSQTVIRLARLGYYSDPRTAPEVGFDAALQAEIWRARPLGPHLARLGLGEQTQRADTVIVGSGPAGTMLARELAATGRRVVVIERGPYVEPAALPVDEIERSRTVAADGVLPLITSAQARVLDGRAVGGDALLSHSRAVRPPASLVKNWTEAVPEWAELPDLKSFCDASLYALPAADWPGPSPGAKVLHQGLAALAPENVRAEQLEPVDLAALPNVLADAQERYGLTVVANCRAESILTEGDRALGVNCVLEGGARLHIAADEVIVAAGAIGSSLLLRRSRLGARHAGRELFYIASCQTLGDFPERIDAYGRAPELLVYGDPRTTLAAELPSPPLEALLMPGWFEDHEYNMRRCDHMVGITVSIGTSPGSGRLPDDALGPADLKVALAEDDYRRLRGGLKLAGQLLLAAGARRVLPPTIHSREYTKADQLAELDTLPLANELLFSSLYPLGGNAMSTSAEHGGVDSRFRLHGYRNLYLCDGSVLPVNPDVDPQVTVMAMGSQAASVIAEAA